jgi:hypothetical protein
MANYAMNNLKLHENSAIARVKTLMESQIFVRFKPNSKPNSNFSLFIFRSFLRFTRTFLNELQDSAGYT